MQMAGNIDRRLNRILTTLNSNMLAQEAYKKFVDVTPIDTGYAKRNTKLAGNEINADYPYAGVLDEGRGYRDGQMRGSEQAPDGMSQPTIEHLRDYVYQKTGIRIK
jgi:hypothetical protein